MMQLSKKLGSMVLLSMCGVLLAGCENNEKQAYLRKQEQASSASIKKANDAMTPEQKQAAKILAVYDANNPYTKISHTKTKVYQDGFELPSSVRKQALQVEAQRTKVLSQAHKELVKEVSAKDAKTESKAARYLKLLLVVNPYSQKELKQQLNDRFDKDLVETVLAKSNISYNELAQYKVIQEYGLKDLPKKSVISSMLKEQGFAKSEIRYAVLNLPDVKTQS